MKGKTKKEKNTEESKKIRKQGKKSSKRKEQAKQARKQGHATPTSSRGSVATVSALHHFTTPPSC